MPDAPPSLPHRKLCQRYNDPGHAHFLTYSCFHRQPFLSRDRVKGWLCDALTRGLDEHEFHLWAYVVMPEHLHLVVYPTTAMYDISSFLKSTKQSVALKAVAHVRTTAPEFLVHMKDGQGRRRFWQRGGGYDHNLWTWERIWDKIDYIHANPVRRGLCNRPADWIWSSAADYLALRQGPLRIDRTYLPPDPRY